ncbi:hypothetical protein LX97_00738 [Nonlabens dokdonensis]|jgi:hypothetical protein|uniref:Uncharacterized protein n=2 Tax=Nonlabens dokdonensis TaxID=328515 RepID=L7WAX1_NONDD|nr:hypothetical protein [Nonlabens dokdonensis]AGC76063.1 hypothetical protein DDD_0936 [Nonlabens dokdonensis DSW-6]PZX43735.1 hypothetical protein LX97_00738 [Nonlabens dokdonensis]
MEFPEPTVLVFRTSIESEKDIKIVTHYLNNHKAIFSWNLDLEDWENILRLEVVNTIFTRDIIKNIKRLGYECEELH